MSTDGLEHNPRVKVGYPAAVARANSDSAPTDVSSDFTLASLVPNPPESGIATAAFSQGERMTISYCVNEQPVSDTIFMAESTVWISAASWPVVGVWFVDGQSETNASLAQTKARHQIILRLIERCVTRARGLSLLPKDVLEAVPCRISLPEAWPSSGAIAIQAEGPTDNLFDAVKKLLKRELADPTAPVKIKLTLCPEESPASPSESAVARRTGLGGQTTHKMQAAQLTPQQATGELVGFCLNRLRSDAGAEQCSKVVGAYEEILSAWQQWDGSESSCQTMLKVLLNVLPRGSDSGQDNSLLAEKIKELGDRVKRDVGARKPSIITRLLKTFG
jgi:hypothetical protein